MELADTGRRFRRKTKINTINHIQQNKNYAWSWCFEDGGPNRYFQIRDFETDIVIIYIDDDSKLATILDALDEFEEVQ